MAAALSFFPIWPWGAAWLFLAGAYALFVVGILHAVRVRDYA
jgi:hypothetical protein